MLRLLICSVLLLSQSALAQQEIILQGAGNLQYADGSDGRKKLYSGDSSSHIVEKHQRQSKNMTRHLGGSSHQTISSETSSIYRCYDGQNMVFVDEDNRGKFRSCSRVSAKNVPPPLPVETLTPPPNPADHASLSLSPETAHSAPESALTSGSPCSGALLYQGNTYLFSEHEPCPIAHELFTSRKPLESQADYYNAPTGSVHDTPSTTP